ncbi:MAG: GDP-mannose 4,6-dehydratase [Candidatus Promineifilaceae bacterium]
MKFFITGGAGFIGCNSAEYFLNQGHAVTVFDNLSRPGTEKNLAWLRGLNSAENLHFIQGDIRNYDALCASIGGSDVVLHLAGQVAVTTSVVNPREDFEINALGTFNVLEAVRNHCPDAIVINASTNKVYGGMESVQIVEQEDQYAYADYPCGIPETFPLDFHSPYGCSKGAADQYALDYARIYGLKTVSLRQSCIYGSRQFGIEDQGWVAHFVIAVVKNRPISIYGDGKQVRDVLHISDLIQAYEAAIANIGTISGQAFNIGGGSTNTLSIWSQFGPILETLVGKPIPVQLGDWRPGDQHVFVADIRKAHEVLGWKPDVSPHEGIAKLYEWVSANPDLFD